MRGFFVHDVKGGLQRVVHTLYVVIPSAHCRLVQGAQPGTAWARAADVVVTAAVAHSLANPVSCINDCCLHMLMVILVKFGGVSELVLSFRSLVMIGSCMLSSTFGLLPSGNFLLS